MDKFEIQKLREIPIESVAERLGLTVKKHRCLCPFHDDKSPSLSFSTNRNTYRCWSCSARGDPIDLVRRHLNLNFPDACRWLADESNIILTEYKPKEPPVMTPTTHFNAPMYEDILRRARLGIEASEFLFHDRHLDPEVINSLGIKAINYSGQWFLHILSQQYSDAGLREAGLKCGEGNRMHCYFFTPCLLIPYRDVDSNLIGLQSRYLGQYVHYSEPSFQARHEEVMRRAPRFMFLRHSRPSIYNLPVLKTLVDGEELWIAEGCSDCWAMLSSGKKAIAIPSATLLTQQNRELLRQYASHQTWHVAPDCDEAGEKLYHELLAFATEIGVTLVRHQLPEGCKDFSDYWKSR